MWWYFRIESGSLVLAEPSEFQERPLDANPCDGNVFTPWYNLEDHADNVHAHVKADTYSEALEKATLLTKGI